MNEAMKELMANTYTVPEETPNELRVYALAAALRPSLTPAEQVVLDTLMEACVEWVGDVEEAAFEQGVLVGRDNTFCNFA